MLERNLCFVDTPAISLSRPGQTDAILQYMRQQFHRATAALNSSSVDMQNLLAGNGGSQVDAIIYLVSNGKILVPASEGMEKREKQLEHMLIDSSYTLNGY